MLGPVRRTACRCASTSTAAPCRHGVREDSRHANTESTKTNSHREGAALDYAAPLWSTATGSPHWFYAARPAWTDWKRNAAPPPATYLPAPIPLKSPVLDETIRSQVGPTTLEKTATSSARLPDTAEGRVSTYLRSRGQRTALEGFRDEYGEIFDVAERADMPLLRAMVLEDQELAGTSHRGLKLLEIERFATNRPKEGGEFAHAVRTGADRSQIPTLGSAAATQGRRRRSKSHVGVNPTPSTESSRPDTLPHDPAARLVAYVAGVSTDLEAADQAWKAFSTIADFESSDDDLRIALDFLLRLCRPVALGVPQTSSSWSPPPVTSEQLSLALQVLRRLLDVFPDDVVRPEPTGSDLPQPVRLQVVLVRTVLEIALREGLSDLSIEALHALGTLRKTYAALAASPESTEDAAAIDKVLQRGLVTMREERQTLYTPTLRDEAWSCSAEVAQLAALVRLRYAWSRDEPWDSSEPMSRSSTRLLSAYVDECAARHRWDLVAECWRLWSKRGWSIGRQAVPLARWLAGASAPDTYGPGGSALSTPVVNPGLLSRLANETTAALQSGWISSDWTAEDKNDWVDLLCASRAASRATRQCARRSVAHWQQVQPVGSPAPFVLRGSTLLNMVRTALPPYDKDFAYPRQLLSAHVASLVNPASPYASTDGHIEHFDLTTLAQAFTLAGDHASVGQIYRRALEQKHLPDAKDVGVVLADVARRHPHGALEQVARAAASGLKIDLELLQAVLKAQLDQLRSEGSHAAVVAKESQLREAIAQACALATRLGLPASHIASLCRFGEEYLAADPASDIKPSRRGTNGGMSAARAVGDLLTARRTNDWRLAHRLFTRTLIRDELGRTVAHGIRDERVLTLCLETLLKADRSKGYRTERLAIRDAIAQVLDAAIAPLAQLNIEETPTPAGNVTLVRSRAGLDLVLEAHVRATEPEVVDALMALLERQADLECEDRLDPSDSTNEKVVRWAVARRGRDVVLGQATFVGAAARHVLNLEKGTELVDPSREQRSLRA